MYHLRFGSDRVTSGEQPKNLDERRRRHRRRGHRLIRAADAVFLLRRPVPHVGARNEIWHARLTLSGERARFAVKWLWSAWKRKRIERGLHLRPNRAPRRFRIRRWRRT